MRSALIACLLSTLFINQATAACTESWTPKECYRPFDQICPQDVCGEVKCVENANCKSGWC